MSTYQGTQTGAEIDDAVAATKGATAGIIVKTGTGTGQRRTIAVDTDDLVVTNGNGVAGNPTLALAVARKTEFTAAATHIADAAKHRLINDSGTTNTVLFSAEKILALNAKRNSVTIGTKIEDSRALVTADANKLFLVDKGTDVTLTINEAQFAEGDRIEFVQVGVGKIIFALENGTDQAINAQLRSTGAGQKIELVCIDDTTSDEVFFAIGGEANA